MQNVTSFVKAKSPLSLAISGEEPKKSAASKSDKNLFSLLLASLANLKAGESIDLQAPKKQSESSLSKETNVPVKTAESKAKSLDEHLLSDLLKVIDMLKTQSPLPLVPILKSPERLEKILNNATALKEFGEVKSLGDLLSLSKKYDLGLEKISVSKQSAESLQKEFPTLAKSAFFEQILQEETLATTPIEETKSTSSLLSSSSILDKTIKKSDVGEQSSALKELMSKELTTPKEEVKISKEVIAKENFSPSILANESKKVVNSAEQTIIQKVVAKPVEKHEEIKMPPQTQITQENEQETIDTKPSVLTRMSEVKAESAPLGKGMMETILQTIKSEKTQPTSLQANAIEKPVESEENQTTASYDTIAEINNTNETNLITQEQKTSIKSENAPKQVIAPKETFNHFAQDFKEKLEAYRPPIMKVELSLFPKSLGEVDVTLLTRGNNLHVNIMSTTSTMSVFTQNQAEFKNALINMGFHNLEMNFSDQRGHEGQSGQQKQSQNTFFDEISEDVLAKTSIELIVPHYV